MIQGYYSAAGAMIAQQIRINAISDNIANVNTDGYKRRQVAFEGALSSVYYNDAGAGGAYRIGNGVAPARDVTDMSHGPVDITGEAFDLAIDGEGFFTLDDGGGRLVYSRGGSFSLSHEDGVSYLTDSRGYYLLDTTLGRVTANADIAVLGSGAIIRGGGLAGYLRIVNAARTEDIVPLGGGLYEIPPGAVTAEGTGAVLQGAVERSNADLTSEMTSLIRAQRLFGLNSKVAQTIDEMKAAANSLRK
ncbi:MAG: flagellar hook-basal body protein [Clostridiales bacterium]|nr:flagellar hook-basal body protein [Clostridiales bacterium]